MFAVYFCGQVGATWWAPHHRKPPHNITSPHNVTSHYRYIMTSHHLKPPHLWQCNRDSRIICNSALQEQQYITGIEPVYNRYNRLSVYITGVYICIFNFRLQVGAVEQFVSCGDQEAALRDAVAMLSAAHR